MTTPEGTGTGETGWKGIRSDLLRISEAITASHGPKQPCPRATEVVLLAVAPDRLHAYWQYILGVYLH